VAEVVIIGAGLTGLSSAYWLEKNNFFDYKIFEKQDRPGGLLRSEQHDGFTFDHTGHLLHINDPSFYDFLNEIAAIEDFNLITRQSGIYSNNVVTEYPFQMNLHGLPTDVIAECIEGYVTRNQAMRKPKSFYEWVLKYFGKGMGEHFFFPYNSKILSYNLKKVHPSWNGRFVPSTTLKAIIDGTLQPAAHTKIGYNSSFYYPKQGGIEFIVKKLVAYLKNPVQTGYGVSHIDTTDKIVYFDNGQQERYKHLVTTMPLNRLLTTIKTPSRSSINQAADKLLCNAVININIGFSGPIDTNKHWLYFPERTYPFYRLGFWHTICPSSVPTGHSALYSELSYLPGRTTQAQAYKRADLARKQVLDFVHMTADDIVAQKILHLDNAYVIYDAWREKNLVGILQHLHGLQIHSIGRYGEWKYSSMQDAYNDGKKVAMELMQVYNTSSPTIVPAQLAPAPSAGSIIRSTEKIIRRVT